ncbi:MAG: Gfo/Idh/MocA family oxidoreductase [Victivallaceae bacterium]|nr:Gfo/Idh/MocA family oxidoreductase [Victivallaceae bacterium]
MKKIAVIGFGFMGVTHAKNILANKNLELCAIIDNRENIFAGIENTGNHGDLDLPLAELYRVPIFKTLKECVNKTQPDAALICVPLFLHYDLTKKALNLELDVLLEKPFCAEPGQCQELIELAERKKRLLMVAHCIRFAPEWEFLTECIRDKRYGELKLLSTTRICGEPTWGIWQDKKIKNTCGGALMDLLIHDIDFANYCLGRPEDIKLNLNIEEYWELELKYKDQPAKISIKGGFLYRHTAFASEYAATFENGSIRFSTLQPGIIEVSTDTGAVSSRFTGNMYNSELEYFAKCIRERNNPEKCLPESSKQAIEICNEIRNLNKKFSAVQAIPDAKTSASN